MEDNQLLSTKTCDNISRMSSVRLTDWIYEQICRITESSPMVVAFRMFFEKPSTSFTNIVGVLCAFVLDRRSYARLIAHFRTHRLE